MISDDLSIFENLSIELKLRILEFLPFHKLIHIDPILSLKKYNAKKYTWLWAAKKRDKGAIFKWLYQNNIKACNNFLYRYRYCKRYRDEIPSTYFQTCRTVLAWFDENNLDTLCLDLTRPL